MRSRPGPEQCRRRAIHGSDIARRSADHWQDSAMPMAPYRHGHSVNQRIQGDSMIQHSSPDAAAGAAIITGCITNTATVATAPE